MTTMQPKRHTRPAFTLVELMISIAMVLLLILGVNAIFRTTADTIGGGQAAINTTRELRNAYDTLNMDFNGFLVPDTQPVLVIYNQNLPGFRDKADEKSDTGYTPGTNASYNQVLTQYDAQGNAHTPPRYPPTPPAPANTTMSLWANNRNHRVDIISFVSANHYRQQTGLQNSAAVTYQSTYGAEAAYVWLGHLRLPAGTQNTLQDVWLDPESASNNANVQNRYVAPGMTPRRGAGSTPQAPTGLNPNANNFYANQWILGRMAILMSKPQPTGAVATPATIDNNGISMGYLDANAYAATPPPVAQILSRPFGAGTPATWDGTGSNPPKRTLPSNKTIYTLADSQCDLAGIDVAGFWQRVKDAASGPGGIAVAPQRSTWYLPLLWQPFPSTTTATNNARIEDVLRFAAKPWPTRDRATATSSNGGNPLSAAERRDDMALTAPAFIHGCSQFIVEFAGDYMTQDVDPSSPAYGNINGEASDGNLDFEYIRTGPQAGRKRIRWYGLPRNYEDNATSLKTQLPDVAPVFLALQLALGASVKPLPFEHDGYSNATGTTVPDTTAFPRRQVSPQVRSYVCAWGPYDLQFPRTDEDGTLLAQQVPAPGGGTQTMAKAYPNGFMPWMIRLTIRVDDPNGRLPDGQTIQYVFNLPHK